MSWNNIYPYSPNNNAAGTIQLFIKCFNPIKADVPGSHDSLWEGQFDPPPINFHYIIGKYNILYIFEKLLFMPFRLW